MAEELTYPVKVILAWGEAISGNTELRDWLMKNGYPELGLFVFALNLKDSAREWLMQNGYPHLMATIHGAEGDAKAIQWLKNHNFELLEKVALGADNDDEAVRWLIQKDYRDLAGISLKIRSLKNDIERSNNDIHSISKE
jgi:hypothetical protein